MFKMYIYVIYFTEIAIVFLIELIMYVFNYMLSPMIWMTSIVS